MDSYSSTFRTMGDSSSPPRTGTKPSLFGKQQTFRHFLGLGIDSPPYYLQHMPFIQPLYILPFLYVNGIIDICRKLFYTMCIQGGVPMDFSSYFPIWNKLTPTQQQILERNAVLRKVDNIF